METQGCRVYFLNGNMWEHEWKCGDYGKAENGDWFLKVPEERLGGFYHLKLDNRWTITEHDDGTITVNPSILIRGGPDGKVEWHGYLVHGVWRTC